MNKFNKFLLGLLLTFSFTLTIVGLGYANDNLGYLEIIGVPANISTGTYYNKTDILFIDVQDIDGAYVRITMDDLVITGRVVELHGKDNYLKVTVDATLEQKDFSVIADHIEYFSKEERLLAQNNLEVTTEDAVVHADRMIHFETEEKTEFLENVIVTLTESRLFGEHFILYGNDDRMEFIGGFKGEFER